MIGGRIWASYGTGRYSADAVVDEPIELIEYVKRRGNWADNEGTPLIKTSGNGSFDDSSLVELRLLTVARQVFNKEQQWTDALSKSICETFYLLSRIDEDGYECVEYLLKSGSPSDTVTVADIIPGSLGTIKHPRPENVYLEPYINYAYDYASEKFTQSLRIEGIEDNITWDSTLTPGFQGNDGESLWYTQKQRYLKYGHFERIPQNLSDQYWIVDYDTALWKMQKMIQWMGLLGFSFSVHYTQAREWYCGKQININFPIETNDIDIKSVIVGIDKSKRNNRVNLELLLLEEIPSDFYFAMYQTTDSASAEYQLTDGASTEWQEG